MVQTDEPPLAGLPKCPVGAIISSAIQDGNTKVEEESTMAMTKAYVLIETEVGKAAEVATALRAIPGIAAADSVTGPYDVIAVVLGADVNTIGRLVMTEIHGLPGLRHTLTCIVVSE
jgi:DNA-binding Lrp family transcriptional regulator